MKNNVKKISIGIRYRRSFRIPELAGEITDFILGDESPFGSNFFTEVGAMDKSGKILLSENGSSLSIDLDSLILNLIVDDDIKTTILKINNNYYPYLVKLLKKFRIENFNRLGMVFEHQLDNGAVINKIVKTITKEEIDAPDNLQLRFSKKIPKIEALVKKEIIDYGNIICTYNKNLDGLNIKLDYQIYFSPEIASISDVEFEKIFLSSQKYLEDKFYKWQE